MIKRKEDTAMSTKKKPTNAEPADTKTKDLITLDGIDKDLSGLIVIAGPDTAVFRNLSDHIRSHLDIPEKTAEELLDYRRSRPEGIFFCGIRLSEEDMESARQTLYALADRYGNENTRILLYNPDFCEEISAKLEEIKTNAYVLPEETIRKHMELLDSYTKHIHFPAASDFVFYMCKDPMKATYDCREPLNEIRSFLSRFHARKFVKTEEWKTDLLARKDLVKVLPDKDSPLPKQADMVHILYLTDIAPLDRSVQDTRYGKAKKWLREQIKAYENKYERWADAENLAYEICREVACNSSIPTVYAKQPDTVFPMVLPNCFTTWDKTLGKNEAQLRKKLEPFFTLAGKGAEDMTKLACVLKSMMEPAGSAGYGVYLAGNNAAQSMMKLVLDPLVWFHRDNRPRPEDYALTADLYNVTKTEMQNPEFWTDMENTVLDKPGACNHVTAFFGPDASRADPSGRILKLSLPGALPSGKTGRKPLQDGLRSALEDPAAPSVIAKWVKELSFNRASGTYFGIKEILAGKLPDNPLINPAGLPVSGIAAESE